ncbi:MAG TPA: hypothetical protein DCS93_38415 [Microscillaceae bacterium]|nr:hypothetical protein [Microscillaceae bacterium]
MKYIFSFLLAFGAYTLSLAQTHFGNSVGVQGAWHSFFGVRAGQNNTGSFNSFMGHRAGMNNTVGYENNFLGAYTGLANTTGHHNVFVGRSAGGSNTTGQYNAFLGHAAGMANTNGHRNTFLGHRAGNSNQSGSHNTYLGVRTAHNNVSGHYNTAVGSQAGHNNTGSKNVFIGHQAGYLETGSNQLYIHNSDAPIPLIYGDFAAGGVGINTKKLVDPLDGAFYTLSVNGLVRTTELRVYPGWADYVFATNYRLRPLEEVARYIEKNKHLPDVPSAKEVARHGVKVGEMDATLLRKIEELTLYMIEADKTAQSLQQTLTQTEKHLTKLRKEATQVKKKYRKRKLASSNTH